jgi:hypothetical protein
MLNETVGGARVAQFQSVKTVCQINTGALRENPFGAKARDYGSSQSGANPVSGQEQRSPAPYRSVRAVLRGQHPLSSANRNSGTHFCIL